MAFSARWEEGFRAETEGAAGEVTGTPKEVGRRGRQNGFRLSGLAARNLWPGKSSVHGCWVGAMLLGGGGGEGEQDGRRSRDCCGEDGRGLQWMWAEAESLLLVSEDRE